MTVHIDFMDIVALVIVGGWVLICLILWLYVSFTQWLYDRRFRRRNNTKEKEEE